MRSSSGNVLADLELANSEELLIKAELVRQIHQLITMQKLTQLEYEKLWENRQDFVRPAIATLLGHACYRKQLVL